MAIQRVDFGRSPRLIWVEEATNEISLQTIVNELRDFEDDPINNTYDQLIAAAGKEALGGGVLVGITATLQNARLAFTPTMTPTSSGTITTLDTTGELLIDSSATFISDGVTIGSQLFNHTDGSTAMVTEVVSETQIECTPLAGGFDNQFQTSDNYDVHPIIQKSISGGNLVAIDDVGAELNPVFPTPFTQVNKTSASSATLQELDAIQFSSFGDVVTVDTGNVTGKAGAGTAFPTGTRQRPVNNMTDALAIAEHEGLNTFYVIGNLVLNDISLNLTDYIFLGHSIVKTSITVDTLAVVNGAEFFNATVTGILDGGSVVRDCHISNLQYFNGSIGNCAIIGTITLAGGADADIFGCRSGIPGNSPAVIVMGGSGQSLGLHNYSGNIQMINQTGTSESTVQIDPGECIIDSTVTGGTITVRGNGTITDNSTGTAVVDSKGLVDPSTALKFTDLLVAKKVNV